MDIIARLRPILDRNLATLGAGQTLGQLDWDSLQWSTFMLELFAGQSPVWRDHFFRLAFLENDLAQLSAHDFEQLLLESWNATQHSA